jgi:hypothetical protein
VLDGLPVVEWDTVLGDRYLGELVWLRDTLQGKRSMLGRKRKWGEETLAGEEFGIDGGRQRMGLDEFVWLCRGEEVRRWYKERVREVVLAERWCFGSVELLEVVRGLVLGGTVRLGIWVGRRLLEAVVRWW